MDVSPRSRDTTRPRFAKNLRLKRKEAQGRPGARCTRGLVCIDVQKMRTRAYRFSGNTPAFPAQWSYGLYRALPGDRLSCHRHQRDAKHHRRLDASIGASGPHDFAVRNDTIRQLCRSRPPHPAPTFVTIGQTPLFVGRDGDEYATDLGPPSREILKIGN